MEWSAEYEILPGASALTDVLGSALTATYDDRPTAFQAIRLPPLRVGSGEIVVCDPQERRWPRPTEPFVERVPNGLHEVTAAMVAAEKLVAFVQVRFRSSTVARWALANRPGEDIRQLRSAEAFGFSVDSGTACVADAAAYARIRAEEDTVRLEGYDWLTLFVEEGSMSVFRSGFGDGFYASYFGLGADGKPVLMVIDLGVVDWPGRPA